MRRVLALLLLLTVSGCARAPKPVSAPPQPEPQPTQPAEQPGAETPPAPPPAPPATAGGVPARQQTLDSLTTDLARYLNEGGGEPAQKLNLLLDSWGGRQPMISETDLNGLGRNQFVLTLSPASESGMLSGTVFVIDQRDGRWQVDRGPEAFGPDGASLIGVRDLTGDGKAEIVWSTSEHGAHTAFAEVHAATWAPGRVEKLPGDMRISMPRISLDGKAIVLQGGTVGSAGAGMAQRDRIDRFEWVDGQFRLVSRRYAPSAFAYHRAQDGVVAEGYEQWAEALTAYREALEPGRTVLPADFTPPEWQPKLNEAVRAFARFRLGALLMERGKNAEAKQVLEGATGTYAGLFKALLEAGSRSEGCEAANAWARGTDFLEALNSPYGYATPQWDDLCARQLPAGE